MSKVLSAICVKQRYIKIWLFQKFGNNIKNSSNEKNKVENQIIEWKIISAKKVWLVDGGMYGWMGGTKAVVKIAYCNQI